jgi:arginine exporter protein ArgO
MTSSASDRVAPRRSPVQLAALILGVAFLLVGIAGFIPGITTGYDTMQVIGHESHAMLLGVFQVSILHNIVHLVFGVLGVLMARTAPQARLFLLVGGIVYLVLWVYGLVIDHESTANFVPLNTADNWLHLALGVAMVGLSFLHRERSRRPAQPHQP